MPEELKKKKKCCKNCFYFLHRLEENKFNKCTWLPNWKNLKFNDVQNHYCGQFDEGESKESRENREKEEKEKEPEPKEKTPEKKSPPQELDASNQENPGPPDLKSPETGGVPKLDDIEPKHEDFEAILEEMSATEAEAEALSKDHNLTGLINIPKMPQFLVNPPPKDQEGLYIPKPGVYPSPGFTADEIHNK